MILRQRECNLCQSARESGSLLHAIEIPMPVIPGSSEESYTLGASHCPFEEVPGFEKDAPHLCEKCLKELKVLLSVWRP